MVRDVDPLLNPLVIGCLALNVLAFLVFGLDKWCAIRGRRRVPEFHLALLAFFTGFVGAWLGCEVFRHKTRKTSFRIKLFLATLGNALWVWLWWKFGRA